MTRHYIIPIFVPHLGCPHDCVFCNQRKITGLSTNITPSFVEKTIKEHLETFNSDSYVEVAFYGGSFTAIDLDIQKELLKVPYKYKEKGLIQGIRLSTRPDCIDELILNNLREYKVDTIELGVQSLEDTVLYESGRGHTSKDVYEASNLIKDYGINLGLQMMIGLPGDDRCKSLYTCKEFIKLNPFCVRIYPTLVVKDTYLETLYLKDKYIPLTLEEAVDISTELLMLFNYYHIDVIRIGLQPTENIQLGKDVVTGPFHPAFRQLVEANIIKLLLDDYLSKANLTFQNEVLVIQANSRNISAIAGQKSSNINYFMQKYKFNKIKIYPKDMDSDLLGITIGQFYDKINIELLMESYLKEKSII
ncbi:radical SAM protein [Tissierella sp. MSJ-40]|uniref:Radical SAM protein n=1 Tax=Tissierella simiarum TaxID=2841534 RepID=A0ABS6E5C2_9FIRM|nr:radical SAM protein [Tissierella simiarum]MBU5437736.1 radical SAM protein [Tissierella simiarum]